MGKIIITGGNGKLAKKFKQAYSNLVLNPSKEELNLLDSKSIIDYYNGNNEDIDGLVLNATLYPSDFDRFQKFFDVNILNQFVDSFKLVAIGNQQLINLYKDKIKYVVNVSSGITFNKKPLGMHFGYKLQKTISNFIIEEYSIREQYSHIKFITLNPSHMETDEHYEKESKLLFDIIQNIDQFKNGEEYYPWNGVIHDINKETTIRLN